MSSEERRLQTVTELLATIAAHSRRGVPIIVEGPNDVKTLRKLNITGPVICAKSRRLGLADFIEVIAKHHEVIVLTDFDREGRALAWRLRRELSNLRVKANVEIWKQLKALVRSEIVGIESLARYLDRRAARPMAGAKSQHRTRVS